MHALVYTGTEKIVYREEKDPTTKPGETLVSDFFVDDNPEDWIQA